MFSEAIDRTRAKVQHVLCGHKKSGQTQLL